MEVPLRTQEPKTHMTQRVVVMETRLVVIEVVIEPKGA